MASSVLIIEDDEWVSALLGKFLKDEGFQVRVAATAQEGVELALAEVPDCIVCDVTLPDIDGFWVARKIRTEAGPVALTPILFLTSGEDAEERLQGLHVGADAYVTKPFRQEEVVAQVKALLAMAERLRGPDSSPLSSRTTPAFRGDLAHLSIATLLTLFELERRTGRLKVRTEGRLAELELAEGQLVRTRIDDKPKDALVALREVLRWKEGHFWFRPIEVKAPAAARKPVGPLLLEAMRLEDESRSR